MDSLNFFTFKWKSIHTSQEFKKKKKKWNWEQTNVKVPLKIPISEIFIRTPAPEQMRKYEKLSFSFVLKRSILIYLAAKNRLGIWSIKSSETKTQIITRKLRITTNQKQTKKKKRKKKKRESFRFWQPSQDFLYGINNDDDLYGFPIKIK